MPRFTFHAGKVTAVLHTGVKEQFGRVNKLEDKDRHPTYVVLWDEDGVTKKTPFCTHRLDAALCAWKLFETARIEKLEAELAVQRGATDRLPDRPDRNLTEDQAHRVYDILERCCGALPGQRSDFVFDYGHHTHRSPLERKIPALLGTGGKFWNEAHRLRVSAYPEDEERDLEIRRLVAETNLALEELYRELFPLSLGARAVRAN